ncbi:hypothetical protein C9J01_22810 [Photobacterium rosenbergii]|uniref:SpaA-like prealbumin fold domain-containing protein n=1 Tax=Photobacterium rosenbergii TaxID=294936 RepID=A0A2T3N741_9GAMM|nr:hypothetical protein [Photobacterium rosenbergii]PSW08694.1 hypothetical protein C9J01_22810 [Photobacterium rosenbergii]
MKLHAFERIKRHALWGIAFSLGISALPVQAFEQPPMTVQFTLEGCRNDGNPTLIDGSNTLPNAEDNFTCQDPNDLGGNDTPYTSGNLGKGWNELDLVPHRLIATNGDSDEAVTYNVIIAADNADSDDVMGYDQIFNVQIIRSPEINAFSDDSCELMVGDQQIDSSGTVTGGIDDVIYRQLTITQDPNTTCVIDWANRLAIGASDFSGSSLQAYMFESEDFQTGKRTVPIPVREILAAGVRKDMTATEGGDGVVWNVTKQATPATVDLGNTCDQDESNSENVSIRVEWQAFPVPGEGVLVITNIFAFNPSSREVSVSVMDTIFGDADGPDNGSNITPLDTVTSPTEILNPGQEKLVLTHTFNAPTDVSDLSDTAVATFIDTATGIEFPEKPEVTFELDNIQPGPSGFTTAFVSDTERITGQGLTYKVTSLTNGSADGSFSNGYTLNTSLSPTDPDLVWTSVMQETECSNSLGCDVGFAEFNKTIEAAPVTSTTGSLADWALLTASDGSMSMSGTEQSPVQIIVTSSALIDLDVRLAVPALTEPDTLQCTVEVKDSSDGIVATLTYDFDNTVNDITQTIDDIAPDNYTGEVTSCGNLVGDTIKMVDLTFPEEPTLANCSGDLEFVLVAPEPPAPVYAAVDKITMPYGEENGWTMTLTGPNTGPNGIVLVTSDSEPGAYELFEDQNGPFELVEGYYTVTETVREGWVQTASTGCEFRVNLPEDEGSVKRCSFTNKKLGKIIIHKLTKPKYGTGFSFTQNIEGDYEFLLDHGQSKVFEGVVPGNYRVTENDPAPDFNLVDLVCTESKMANTQTNTMTRQADIVLDPGEVVECTYTNRENGMVLVKKLTNGYATNDEWKFTLTGPGVNTFALTPPHLFDFDGIKLTPYEKYTLCEVDMPYGWQSFWMVDINGDNQFDERLRLENSNNDSPINYYLQVSELFNPDYGNIQSIYDDLTLCVNFIVKPGQTLFFQVDNRQVKKTEPVACYDKPIYGNYLSNDDLQANTYMLGDYHVDTCEEAKEVLDKPSSYASADHLASRLFSAKLHEQYGLNSCQQAQTAMYETQSMLENSGYSGYGYQPRTWSNWQASNLIRDLDTYIAGFMCR